MDVLSDQTLKMLDFVQSHAGLYDFVNALPTGTKKFRRFNDRIVKGVVNHSPNMMDVFRNIGMPMLTWDTRPWGSWVGVDGMHFELIDYGL